MLVLVAVVGFLSPLLGLVPGVAVRCVVEIRLWNWHRSLLSVSFFFALLWFYAPSILGIYSIVRFRRLDSWVKQLIMYLKNQPLPSNSPADQARFRIKKAAEKNQSSTRTTLSNILERLRLYLILQELALKEVFLSFSMHMIIMLAGATIIFVNIVGLYQLMLDLPFGSELYNLSFGQVVSLCSLIVPIFAILDVIYGKLSCPLRSV